MAKPFFGKPIRIALDEISTEMLRHIPEPVLANILRNACFNALHRTRGNRHQQYRCKRFFRHITSRLTTPPDDLITTVGLKKVDPQMVLPNLQVEALVSPKKTEALIDHMVEEVKADDSNEYEKALDRLEPKLQAVYEKVVEELAGDLDFDIDDEIFHIQSFDDFKDVFNRYPYAMDMDYRSYGRVLVIGYISARNHSEKLVRRNLALNEVPFKRVLGIRPNPFTNKSDNIRQFIKVVKYRPGTLIRTWTHVEGEGDRMDRYRYRVCTEEGIQVLTKNAYNDALDAWRKKEAAAKEALYEDES